MFLKTTHVNLTHRAAFKLSRHVFLRSGAKTQYRQYGQSQWVLWSNELTQGKETFNINELNSRERHFIRNMDEFQSSLQTEDTIRIVFICFKFINVLLYVSITYQR